MNGTPAPTNFLQLALVMKFKCVLHRAPFIIHSRNHC